MDQELHLLCMSCGEQFSNIPVNIKNCPKCNKLYREGFENEICRRENCYNPVLNPKCPMCIKCYKEVLSLDKKMVKEYFDWALK